MHRRNHSKLSAKHAAIPLCLCRKERIPTRNDGWGNLLFPSPNVEEVACPQSSHEFFVRRSGAYLDKLSLKVKFPVSCFEIFTLLSLILPDFASGWQ